MLDVHDLQSVSPEQRFECRDREIEHVLVVNRVELDVLDQVARVAVEALRAVWCQKWRFHRRLRPEEFGGRVQFTLAPLGASIGLVREGRLRGLAVASPKRASVHPDIPTIAESGYPGFRWDSWSGLFAPAKTPNAVINRLNRDVVRVLTDTEMQQRFAALGMETAPTTPEQQNKFVADQLALVMQLAKKAGIQAR